MRREGELYGIVKGFLEEVKGCERVIVDEVSFREVKKWVVDVAGIRGHEVHCVEVKSTFTPIQ